MSQRLRYRSRVIIYRVSVPSGLIGDWTEQLTPYATVPCSHRHLSATEQQRRGLISNVQATDEVRMCGRFPDDTPMVVPDESVVEIQGTRYSVLVVEEPINRGDELVLTLGRRNVDARREI